MPRPEDASNEASVEIDLSVDEAEDLFEFTDDEGDGIDASSEFVAEHDDGSIEFEIDPYALSADASDEPDAAEQSTSACECR